MTVPGQKAYELPPSGDIETEAELAEAMQQFAGELSPAFAAGERLETSLVYPWVDRDKISYSLSFTASREHDLNRPRQPFVGLSYSAKLALFYMGSHMSVTPELLERLEMDPEPPNLNELEYVQVSYGLRTTINPTGKLSWLEERVYSVCTTVDEAAEDDDDEEEATNGLEDYRIVLGKSSAIVSGAHAEQAAEASEEALFAQLVGNIGLELAETDCGAYIAKAAWLMECLRQGDSAKIDASQWLPPEVIEEARLRAAL